MTDLSERLAALESKTSRPCPIGRILEGLDDASREALRRVLDNPAVTTRDLHKTLQGGGVATSRETISAHRQGFCRCRADG